MPDFLDKIPSDDQKRIAKVAALVLAGKLDGLDIKKLKGHNGLFRVRIGKYRIICKLEKGYGFIIVKIANRNDTTYNL